MVITNDFQQHILHDLAVDVELDKEALQYFDCLASLALGRTAADSLNEICTQKMSSIIRPLWPSHVTNLLNTMEWITLNSTCCVSVHAPEFPKRWQLQILLSKEVQNIQVVCILQLLWQKVSHSRSFTNTCWTVQSTQCASCHTALGMGHR